MIFTFLQRLKLQIRKKMTRGEKRYVSMDTPWSRRDTGVGGDSLGIEPLVWNQFAHQYYVSQGEDLVLTQRAWWRWRTFPTSKRSCPSTHPQNQTLSLFGIMPIKTVAVQECQDLTVIPSGEAFGVKMFSQGAVVVGFSPVVTAHGTKEPYQGCDIQEGDIICKVNQKEVTRNEEISYLIRESGGEPMELTLQREDGEHTVTLTPVLSSTDGTYKIRVVDSGQRRRHRHRHLHQCRHRNLCRSGPPYHRSGYRNHPAGGSGRSVR